MQHDNDHQHAPSTTGNDVHKPADATRRHLLAVGLAGLATGGLTIAALNRAIAQTGPNAGPHESQGSQMTGHMMGHGETGAPPYTPERLLAVMGRSRIEDLPLRGPHTALARLPSEIVDGVREFRLSAEPVLWEYAPGQTIMAWGYNGQVPGPEIRVTEGERVRIAFTNRLPVPTSLHWHGLHVPFGMDGVPGVTQPPVQPGATFVYEFEARPAGTRFYHTHGSHHGDESVQMDMGLAGAFIVEPRGRTPSYDRELTLVLSEARLGAASANVSGLEDLSAHGPGGEHASGGYNLFMLNGRIFPHVPSLKLREGERVQIRIINAGSMSIHPMHLHGHSFQVVAIDGNDVPEAARQMRDVVTLAPGERYDVAFVADNPGTWVLHCHELHHAAMGMIMLVEYEGTAAADMPTTPPAPPPAAANGGHQGHH